MRQWISQDFCRVDKWRIDQGSRIKAKKPEVLVSCFLSACRISIYLKFLDKEKAVGVVRKTDVQLSTKSSQKKSVSFS